MKKGLTNHSSGCIMQDVKGNGVFEQTLKDAIFARISRVRREGRPKPCMHGRRKASPYDEQREREARSDSSLLMPEGRVRRGYV